MQDASDRMIIDDHAMTSGVAFLKQVKRNRTQALHLDPSFTQAAVMPAQDLDLIGAAPNATVAAPNESDPDTRLDAFQPPSADMLASVLSLLLPNAGVESTPTARGSR